MPITRASSPKNHHKRSFVYGVLSAAALMAAVQAASAAPTNFTWLSSPHDDNWSSNLTSIDWSNGTSNVAWVNEATSDTALFTGPSTTITVTETIQVTTVTFSTDGWVLAGGAGGGLSFGSNGLIGPVNFNVAAGDTATVNVPIVGSTTELMMQGPGTLVVGSMNTYGGFTSVTGGTLRLTGAIVSSTINLSGGGVFDFVANTGSLNGATGSTLTMKGGTFVYDNTGSSGSKSQNMMTLTFSAGDNTVQNIRDTAAASSLTFSTLAAHTAGATGNFISGGGTDTNNAILIFNEIVSGVSTVTPAGFMSQGLFFNGADYAVMNGAGTFVRAPVYGTDTGAGFAFVAADTSGASLADSSSSNYLVTTASIASQSTAGANTIKFGGGGTVNMTLASNATVTLASGGLLVSGGTSTTIGGSGSADITGASGIEFVFRADTAGDSLTINVPIVANGVNALTKSGAGTLFLGGANTYTGTTTVDAGTLMAEVASVANVSGAFGRNSAVSLVNYPGAVLNLNNFNTQIGSLTGGGTAGGNVVLGTAILTVGGDNTSPTAYLGTISGGAGGGVTKIGTGVQTLSGVNTYAGPTTVTAGRLEFTNEVSLYNNVQSNWTAANISVASGAMLAINVGGVGQFTAADIQAISALGSATGGFASGAYLALDTQAEAGSTYTYSNIISNPNGGLNALGIAKLGTGTSSALILSGNNTYTGPTTVTGGVLAAGIASAPDGSSGAFGSNSAVILPNTVNVKLSLTNPVTLASFNTQIGSLTGGGTLGGNVVLGTATLTVGGDNTSPAAYGGIISGTGGLIKIGTGVLTLTGGVLSGNPSYTGPTSVTNGTLRMNGVSTSSGFTVGNAITADVSPTLGGGKSAANGGALNSNGSHTYTNSATVGNIEGPVTILGAGAGSAGHLAPGNSVGTLSVNSLALNTDSVLDYEFNTVTPSNDLTYINGTGALAIGSGGDQKVGINLYQEGTTNPFAAANTYDLIRYDPTVSITGDGISDLSVLNPQAGFNYAFGTATLGLDNYITLTITGTAVPEPASLALLALGGIGLLTRRRRS